MQIGHRVLLKRRLRGILALLILSPWHVVKSLYATHEPPEMDQCIRVCLNSPRWNYTRFPRRLSRYEVFIPPQNIRVLMTVAFLRSHSELKRLNSVTGNSDDHGWDVYST